ncbi:MAG: hypothetical protein M3Q27_03685 [Actinomycetota bacterium]|nr:hypothetical protein [Actinomycetota bacterium]
MLGWLLRIVVSLSALGAVGFDVVSVAATHVSLAQAASEAAREASSTWRAGPDVRAAYDAALTSARTRDTTTAIDPETFVVDPDGTVHLQARREAATVLVRHVPPLRRWTTVRQDGTARVTAS